MAGSVLKRLDIFGGAARLVKCSSLSPQPTKLEDIITTLGVNRGTLKATWSDIGATDGGLKETIAWETQEWEVDQTRFPVNEQITKVTYTLATSLAEASLENLQFGWDLDSITSTAAVSGTNVCQRSIPLGVPGAFAERMLAFIVERPEYGTAVMRYRAYVFYICSRGKASSEHAFTKKDKVLIPVEFIAKPDNCKTDLRAIGLVMDECIADAPPCP